MSQLTIIIIASWLAGFAAFGGGVIAWSTVGANTDTKREVTHGIIAFGATNWHSGQDEPYQAM